MARRDPSDFRDPPLPLRLAEGPDEGIPIMDLINERAGGPRAGADTIAFVQEWDHLVDELGRDPTVKEFAERWRRSRATVYRELETFRTLFPTENTPRRLLALLWDGLRWDGSGGLGMLMGVRVAAGEPE